MADIQTTYCIQTYVPVKPCEEVILCLKPEWADKTTSGLPYIVATVTNSGRAGNARYNEFSERYCNARCEDVYQYTITYDDSQLIVDPDTGEPYTITPEDICGLFPYKCIFDLLLAQGGGSVSADWVIDQDNVGEVIDQAAGVFDITLNIIDRLTSTPQGSFTLSLGQLFDSVAISVIDALDDVDTTSNLPANGDLLTWDGTNWVPSAPCTFTVNAGATAVATDDSNGSETVECGDIIHFWSSDASVEINVSSGSVVTDIKVAQSVLDQIDANTSSIATNSANISNNTSNIATNATDIATTNSNVATNTSNIATNTNTLVTHNAQITANAAAISSNITAITANAALAAANAAAIAALVIPSSINDLSDVSTPSPVTGDLLGWDGTNWVPSTVALTGLCDADSDTCFEVERTADDDTLRGKTDGVDAFTYTLDEHEEILDLSLTPTNPTVTGILRHELGMLDATNSKPARAALGLTSTGVGGHSEPVRFAGSTVDRGSNRTAGAVATVADSGSYSAMIYAQADDPIDRFSKVQTVFNRAIMESYDGSVRTHIISEPNRIRIRDGAQTEGQDSDVLMNSTEAGNQHRWRPNIGWESAIYSRSSADATQTFSTTATAMNLTSTMPLPSSVDNWLASSTASGGTNSGTQIVIGEPAKQVRGVTIDIDATFNLPALAIPTDTNIYEVWLQSADHPDIIAGVNDVVDGSRRRFTISPTSPTASISISHLARQTSGAFFNGWAYEVVVQRVVGTEDITVDVENASLRLVRVG